MTNDELTAAWRLLYATETAYYTSPLQVAQLKMYLRQALGEIEAHAGEVEKARKDTYERSCRTTCLDCDAGEVIEKDKYDGSFAYTHVFKVNNATFRRGCKASAIRASMSLMEETENQVQQPDDLGVERSEDVGQ